MPTVGEEIQGRGGNLKSMSRRYTVDVSGSGSPEADVVDWVLSNAPSTLAGLVLNDITLEENPEIADLYEATAQYGAYAEGPVFPQGSVEYRFNFQAQGVHAYQSLETIASYVPSGTPRDFKGAINVVADGGKLRCEGYEIQPPAETFTLAYYPVNSTVNSTYQGIVNDLCGKVNNGSFRGMAAGTLMLVRVTGGVRTNDDWSLEFGFGYVPNQTSIPVGDITVPSKDGLDLLWPFYGDKIDDDELVKQPLQANVERVWYRGDFSALALPS